jgi:hypothetical protein
VNATAPPGPGAGRAQETGLRRRLADFPPRVLTWVAALPAWTADLGRQLGLDGRNGPVAGLIGRLDAAGLIETREVLGAEGELISAFWLRPTARPELGRYLQEAGTERLGRDLDDLAAAIAAQDLAPTAPGSLSSAQWLRIARDYRADSSGLKLIAEIDGLLDERRLTEATGLAATARALGELASASLLDSARRGQWRIDRAFRIEQDRQRLRYYCRRPAIEQAIADLMLDSGDTWALHLLGDGGVGKTMLIRDLASGRFAADHSEVPPFLVARADFDHLDPCYPDQRPAELLLALAGELAAFTRTRDQYRRYRHFQDAADELHEQFAGPPGPGDGDADLLEKAAGMFAELVNRLDAPVLLILDTCEELAKLYAPGARAPAIDQTFRLLDLVQKDLVRKGAARVRVLLAGRRWLVPPEDDRRRATGPLLEHRSYLRVVPVGGFTRAEAEAYINARERARREENAGAAPLPPALRAGLLERSAIAPAGEGGYSPFELAAYTDWAASDPDLDAERLRSAPGDPYVEWRIIGRLGNDQVRDALGVAAELGRFDRALVTPALTRIGLDVAAAFDGLAAQEWVNVLSLGEDGSPGVIEIDQHLWDRIRSVTAASPDRFRVDRLALGRDAEAVIERTALGGLPAETVEAAVRLLPLPAAARLWQRIEDRAGAEGAWGWAAQVTTRVGAVELARAEQQGPGSPTILAAILATNAAADLHTRPAPGPVSQWSDVERVAYRHPDPETRAILGLRARLGRLAAGDVLDTAVLTEALRASAPRRELLTGAIVAAAHGCVARGQELPGEVAGLLGDLAVAAGVSSAGAAAHLACAVLRLWAGDGSGAAAWADQAIEVADQAARGPARHWADWAGPRRLADQCRLARVIIAWRYGEAIDTVPWAQWRSEALEHLDDIDAERLAAATVRFELGHRPIAAGELARMETAERYRSSRRPSSWLHRQADPLAAELAQARSVGGDPGHGAALLRQRREEAVAAGDDPDTIEACELTLLRLCRRQRTTAFFPAVGRLSRQGTTRTRGEAWLVRALVDGAQPKDPAEAGSWTAWWCCQDTSSLAGLLDAPPRPAPTATPADRAEFAEIFPGLDVPDPGDASPAGGLPDFDPETELRLGRDLTLPPGAAGRAAVAVAELTALRFPERASRQLTAAAGQLRAAGDELGADEAVLLAGLAAARGRDDQAARAAWAAVESRAREDPPGLPAGWPSRADALRRYVNGQPAAERPVPPELMLPEGSQRLVLRVLGSLPGESLGEATAVGTGVVGLAAALAAIGSVDIVSAVIATGVLVLARILAALLPHRFIAARRIVVGQVPAESPGGGPAVQATAVPSRGMRDLSGLSPGTVAGALAGRWPFWSMFAPWHGEWSRSSGTADQAPCFSLDGLGLPGRGSQRLLSLIEITTGDPECQPLPWEQWLGRGAAPGREPSLLWFRRVPGRPPRLSRRGWRLAGAIYRGPRDLAPAGQRAAAGPGEPGLRILHLVGTPVPTRAGWRLRVADAGGESARTPSRGSAEGEDLLSAEQFPLRRTVLGVLQADPVDGPPQPLAELRSGFAACAQDLLDGGAGAVLVIPPLPDAVGRAVIQRVWRAVAGRRRAPSPAALLVTLARVRAMVAAAERVPDTDDDLPGRPDRPALDVLLFLRARTGQRPEPPA